MKIFRFEYGRDLFLHLGCLDTSAKPGVPSKGLLPYTEPAPIIYDTQKSIPVRRAKIHTSEAPAVAMSGSKSSAALGTVPAGTYAKTNKHQTLFTTDYSKLVWQKKSSDRFGLLVCSALVAATVGYVGYQMIKMMYPAKPSE